MMQLIIDLFLLFSIVVVVVDAKRNRFSSASKPTLHRNNRSIRFLQSSSSFSNAIIKLTASSNGGGQDHNFGYAVSISNNRIVVGAYGYEQGRGAVYLFGDPQVPQSGTDYSQWAILTAKNGTKEDYFGNSVAIDRDTIVVGTPGELGFTGAAYVFRIIHNNNSTSTNTNGSSIIGTISQVAKLTASNGMEEDEFGNQVAIHGNYILVAAIGKNEYAGSAYLFGKNPSSSSSSDSPKWTQLQQFRPDDLEEDDFFGDSVAIMEDGTAMVGAVGSYTNAVYVFSPVIGSDNTTSWTQTFKFIGSLAFGSSVAVARNWMVVGAFDQVLGAGAVSLYTKPSPTSSSSWTYVTRLYAMDAAAYDHFGTSVAISNDAYTIVVGAQNYDDSNTNTTDAGAAYLFRRIDSTMTTAVDWTQVGKFVAADPDNHEYLGSSIAIENNIVVVGSYGDSSTSGLANAGSVYVLDTGFPVVTPVPTVSPTLPPTMAPSSNQMDSTPTTTTTKSPTFTEQHPTTSPNPIDSTSNGPPVQQPNSGSDDSIFTPGVIVAAIVGVVIVIIALAYFQYRLKREERQQQQQPVATTTAYPVVPRTPPRTNMPAAAAPAANLEMPILASARTLDTRTDAVFDPTAIAVAVRASNSAGKKLPGYKDQIRSVQPRVLSTRNEPSLQSPLSSPRRFVPQHPDQDQQQQHQQQQLPIPRSAEEEVETSAETSAPSVVQQHDPPQRLPRYRDPPAARQQRGQHFP